MKLTAIAPYRALYQQIKLTTNGETAVTWQPCRVVGYAIDGDEPAYVVEVTNDGESSLRVEQYIRHPAPTN